MMPSFTFVGLGALSFSFSFSFLLRFEFGGFLPRTETRKRFSDP